MEYKTSSLGYSLTLNGPSTCEEYDQLAGPREGGRSACLEDAVFATIYGSTLLEFQEKLAPKIKELFGQDRLINEPVTERARNRAAAAAVEKAKKAGETDDAKLATISIEAASKISAILESVSNYHKRFMAQASPEAKKSLEEAVKVIAAELKVDPSTESKKASVPKAFLDKADEWLAMDNDAMEAKIAKNREAFDLDDVERGDDNRPTKASLARFIKSVVDLM
jgi:hypothetical protein